MNDFIFLSLFLFVLGSIIGSFLNAVIYRLPREIPIGLPRSRCTRCAKVIFWYENIPIASWIFLKGKCSACKAKISPRYPAIELLMGVFFLFVLREHIVLGDFVTPVYYSILFGIFVCMFFIDVDFQIIPDSMNFILAILLLVFNFGTLSWKEMVLGAGVGFSLPFFVTWGFYQIKGKIGLGGGDIKLYTALGLALGPLGIIQNIFLSCFLGAIVGISFIGFKVIDKNTSIPFGPFIVTVASVQILMAEHFSKYWSYLFP